MIRKRVVVTGLSALTPIGNSCVSRYGWGWDGFIQEADAGRGIKFPAFLRPYFTWVVPLLVLSIFAAGYWEKFVK